MFYSFVTYLFQSGNINTNYTYFRQLRSGKLKIDKEILRSEGLDPRQFEGKTIYAPAGCPKCQNTGFFDRMGIFEMIKVDDRVRKMIIEKRDASFIRKKCVDSGMKTMLDDGIEKIIQGITSLDEVFRVIRD